MKVGDYVRTKYGEITKIKEIWENERLKNEPLTHTMSRIDSVVAEIYRRNREQEDYKSRIDKAIEYIEKRNFNEVEIVNEPFNDDFDFKENILNILTGGDEE